MSAQNDRDQYEAQQVRDRHAEERREQWERFSEASADARPPAASRRKEGTPDAD